MVWTRKLSAESVWKRRELWEVYPAGLQNKLQPTGQPVGRILYGEKINPEKRKVAFWEILCTSMLLPDNTSIMVLSRELERYLVTQGTFLAFRLTSTTARVSEPELTQNHV